MNVIRTDLAVEMHEMCKKTAENKDFGGIDTDEYGENGVYVTAIKIKDKNGEKILGKPIGNYITIDAPEIKFSEQVYENACRQIAETIRSLYKITDSTKTLAVGLGNKLITPDALGPTAVSRLMITNHVKTHIPEFDGGAYSSVCAIVPGVLGTTGIETVDIIKGVADKVKPDLVIVIDALAARSVDRIATTFQISDSGINPGSGVENKRPAINEQTLGAKVIAVGVPTVVDAATVASDCIDAAMKNAGYDASEMSGKIREILGKNSGNMMVTPKDIDLVTERAAKTVANGINLALHDGLTFEDIESYVG